MQIDIERVKQLLLAGNYIRPEDLQKAETTAAKRNIGLMDYLLVQGVVTKDIIGQVLADALGVLYADLNSQQPSREEVLRIPEQVGKTYRCIPFYEDNKLVVVTTDDPTQPNLLPDLYQLFPNKEIKLAFSLPEDIDALLPYYEVELGAKFVKIIESSQQVAPEIVDEIIKDALAYHASDIHMDPREEEVVFRFRVDGVLQEVGRIEKKYYESILNRIKIQANLRTDEHFSAQDGAIRFKHDGIATDLRISILPTLDGEKVVIRVLAEYVKGFALADLGLNPIDQQELVKASKKPFGMILISGPTGSGKSTTLYGVLKLLNSPEVNIATIEDPVEYKIQGVNHIQVNPETNLTFAKGLRSIVRQDPDIILVGEIRDEETAEIAVNAALTGHLLLSTFHANDAATCIPRLLYMGVEPFLLASTLELVVAQRLVRKICESCRYSKEVVRDDLKKAIPNIETYIPTKTITLYEGKGCKSCGGKKFKGRTAIYEFIPSSQELQDLILKNPSRKEIWELARKQGVRSLFEDGMEKVKAGATTIEELLRVASPEHDID